MPRISSILSAMICRKKYNNYLIDFESNKSQKVMNDSSIREIFHIEPQGGCTSPGDMDLGTVPARRARKRRFQKVASLAQQESQSMSQNIRLGIQYRFQQGKMQVNFGKFLGYTRGEDGQAVIVPEEAAVVRRIFREYLEGASLVEICSGLEADGILTGAHMPKWRPETVHKMLRNEKYMGDALLQKTYTTDFLTKKKVVNNGIAPQYYVENSHEAIIPKDIFMRVQEEMNRRSNLTSGEGKSRRLYSSKYALSGIVFCGHCGEIYRRIKWNNRGCRSTVWRCVSRVLKKTSGIDCPARTVHEETLHEAVAAAINQVMTLDDDFFETYRRSLDAALGANCELSIREIEDRLIEKQKELIALSPESERYGIVADEIYQLRDDKRQVLLDEATRDTAAKRVEELIGFIREQGGEPAEYDEGLVRKLIEKVMVYDDHFTVIFKSGIDVDIEA